MTEQRTRRDVGRSRSVYGSRSECLNTYAVVFQARALHPGEPADTYPGVNAPRIQKLVPDFWDDDPFLAAGESKVAPVEQVIDVRRQQEAVGAVEALGIGRVPPRLDVARFQMSRLVQSANTCRELPCVCWPEASK
jgi:hypothetical protein